LQASLTKKRGKGVERTAGYDNDEDALRLEFRSDTELDELEATGGLVDTGGRHCRQELRREHRPNLGALVGAAQFQDPRDAESHLEETD